MIHGEAMVLEQSSGQRHLVRGLDKTCAEVTHALFLVLGHNIETRSQELLPQALSRGEVLHCSVLH